MDRARCHGDLTGSIILIREICSIFRAWSENTPEGTARATSSQSCKVKVATERSVFKRPGKVIAVDVVIKNTAEENGEIDVSV